MRGRRGGRAGVGALADVFGRAQQEAEPRKPTAAMSHDVRHCGGTKIRFRAPTARTSGICNELHRLRYPISARLSQRWQHPEPVDLLRPRQSGVAIGPSGGNRAIPSKPAASAAGEGSSPYWPPRDRRAGLLSLPDCLSGRIGEHSKIFNRGHQGRVRPGLRYEEQPPGISNAD